MLRKIIGFTLLALASSLAAQTTVISATVVDTDGTTWANGTWNITFNPNPDQPNPGIYNINGTPLNPAVTSQKGVLDGSGAFSATIYQSTAISPGGSGWTLNICPNAVTLCGVYKFSSSGSTMNLSAVLTTIILSPRFRPLSGTYGYNDGEATIQLIPGSTYWNVTTNASRCYTGSIWGACGGSGSVSCTTVGVAGVLNVSDGLGGCQAIPADYGATSTDTLTLGNPVLEVATAISCNGTNCILTAPNNLAIGDVVTFSNSLFDPICFEGASGPVISTGLSNTQFEVSESSTFCSGVQTGTGGGVSYYPGFAFTLNGGQEDINLNSENLNTLQVDAINLQAGTAINLAAGTDINTSSTGVTNINGGTGLNLTSPTSASLKGNGSQICTDATGCSPSGTAGGDLTGNYPAPTLIAVGSAGSCGDGTHSCQLTFDSKGRETAQANVAITYPGTDYYFNFTGCNMNVTGNSFNCRATQTFAGVSPVVPTQPDANYFLVCNTDTGEDWGSSTGVNNKTTTDFTFASNVDRYNSVTANVTPTVWCHLHHN